MLKWNNDKANLNKQKQYEQKEYKIFIHVKKAGFNKIHSFRGPIMCTYAAILAVGSAP